MSALVKKDWDWDQGTDLAIYLVYKVGAVNTTPAPPENFSAWSVRMDIKEGSTVVGTINSVSVPEDEHTEAYLDDDGGIFITLGRELTMSSHMLKKLSKSVKLSYDIILRDATGSRQIKLVEGFLKVDPSVTLWL